MVKIFKIKLEEEAEEEAEVFSLDYEHKELKKVSKKFIGLGATNKVINRIIVEDNISDEELEAVESKLDELIAAQT